MNLADYLMKLSKKLKTSSIIWELQQRPYSDKEAVNLLKDVLSKETIEWHYHKHQAGYVNALNKIEKELENLKIKIKDVNGNYHPFSELKRKQTWNHAGALLHEVYWNNLGGDGDINKAKELKEDIIKRWGSVNNWKNDFIATALGTKLSGWALLVYDKLYSRNLLNVIVDEHQNGAIWGGIPLIACDMFEHAYYHKDGPDRKTYILNFMNNLNWSIINENYLKFKEKN